MILIFGGAYQGKLTFAQKTFGLTAEDVYTCSGGEIDFSFRCIRSLEQFTWACVHENRDSVAYFQAHRDLWQQSILLCRDLSCGVVPMGADRRAWRQETGRLLQYLAGEAGQVSRIFCGLEMRLK